MKNKTVIVTGGGTGGHLMPAIAICEALYESGYNPILITDDRCKAYLPDSLKFQNITITIDRISGFLSLMKFFTSWAKTLITLLMLYLNEKPKLVIGCGGYSSIPVILTSILTRTNFILHEQNAYVGRTNYFLSYFAKKLFVSFMHTINLPLIDSKRIVWTGIPILEKHNVSFQAKDKVLPSEITLLITGGSQGASIFDEIMVGTMRLLTKKLPDIKFKVIQQVRNAKCEKLKQEYSKIGINAEVANFYHNLEKKYSEADLFIGRAGASTINELIQYNLPGILVPYPFATNNHQYYNAMNLVKFEASWLLKQNVLTPEILAEKTEEIIKNKKIIRHAVDQLLKMQINSKKIIMSEVDKMIDK